MAGTVGGASVVKLVPRQAAMSWTWPTGCGGDHHGDQPRQEPPPLNGKSVSQRLPDRRSLLRLMAVLGGSVPRIVGPVATFLDRGLRVVNAFPVRPGAPDRPDIREHHPADETGKHGATDRPVNAVEHRDTDPQPGQLHELQPMGE